MRRTCSLLAAAALFACSPDDDPQPLEAPTLQAEAGDDVVTLTWADPNVPPASSYDLYWSDSGPVTLASNLVPGVTSPFVHGPLPAGRTYRYAVVAVVASRRSALSEQAVATLPPPTGQLATPVSVQGVTTFGQSLPALPGDPEHFPGQAGYWDLQADFSVASGGFDGPFSGAQLLHVGRLAISPPTLDSLVEELASLDPFPLFPGGQNHGELTFFTPLFTAADGVALAAISDGSTIGLAPLSGERSAFLNPTSDSRLQQSLDLRAATAPARVDWKQSVSIDGGLVVGGPGSFEVALRDPNGGLVAALGPACTFDGAGIATCNADLSDGLGQEVVLSFELRASAPSFAELDDVAVTDGTGLAALQNGDFEADGGWTMNAGAESQNVTSGARVLCVDGPSASPCPTPLVVTRSFFTAPTSPWARLVDVLENPGTAEVTADVVYLTVAAGGGTVVTYDAGGAGHAIAAYDAAATRRDFALVLGDAVPYHRPASNGGITQGAGVVFAVRPIVVPAGGRVALATFLVMDGRYGGRGGGTAATGVEAAAAAIADGFASETDSTFRDWMTRAQLDAVVNF